MERHGLVDFHDKLLMAAKLMENSEIRNIVCAEQKHVLVDEFQDFEIASAR